MGRYHMLWDFDRTRVPVDLKERGVGLNMLAEMVKQDMKKGLIKEWGTFTGEFAGYTTVEGNEVEVMNFIQQYTPFCYFKVHPISTMAQVEEMIKAMTK